MQPALDGTPAAATTHLWDRFIAAGPVVDHAAWLRAHNANRQPVGSCACGDNLLPEAPDELAGGRFDYRAVCRNPDCRYELVAPGGKILRRSSAHSQMPSGWFDHRFPKTHGGS